MYADNLGCPIAIKGPFLGTMSDISIFRNNPLPFDEDELGLADKAYVGSNEKVGFPLF
jgi:hypothetical protein